MGFLLYTNSTNFPAVMELPFSDTQNLFSTIPDVIVNINHGSLYQDVAPQRNLYHLRFPHHSACFWTVEAPRPFSWHNASLGIISVAIFLCLWEGFRVSRDNQNWMQPGWRWLLPRGIRELGEISQICPATKQKKKKRPKGKGVFVNLHMIGNIHFPSYCTFSPLWGNSVTFIAKNEVKNDKGSWEVIHC